MRSSKALITKFSANVAEKALQMVADKITA